MADVKSRLSTESEDMRILLEKNLAVSQEILELSRYVKTYVRWQKIIGWVKVFLIVIPIVWGLLYLPPLFRDLLAAYGLDSGTTSLNANENPDNLLR
ncbi:MAG: hypothetical protein WC441_03480 [Patescibacteria group bacterium]